MRRAVQQNNGERHHSVRCGNIHRTSMTAVPLTLLAVVNRYNDDPRFLLGLTERQKADLVEFLKGL